MSRFAWYFSLIAVICVAAFCALRLIKMKEQNKHQRKHIETAARSMQLILSGIEFVENQDFITNIFQRDGVSWRLKQIVLMPWLDGGDRPGVHVPWNSDVWREKDDSCQSVFTLDKDGSRLPRDQRFTRIMMIVGNGSAFNFLEMNSLDELCKIAPDSILIVEVTNSKVPWLAEGDLQLDDINRTICDPQQLSIGCSHGYDQFAVGFADQEVWIIESAIPFGELEKFLTVEGASQFDRESILTRYGRQVVPDQREEYKTQ